MYWLGIDVGGTFTDLVLYDEASGVLSVAKTPTTPDDRVRGILNGIAKVRAELPRTKRITHGMTLATNAVLEGKGVRLAMVTTRGHRDVLELGRGNRTVLYDMAHHPPPPLVPRSRVHEVDERTLMDGTVLRTPDPEAIRATADRIAAQGAEAVAVCFLHSYMSARNEETVAALLRERLPGPFVCTSAGVLPEFREFERFTTTLLNASVGPMIEHYLRMLEGALAQRGSRADLAIMNSGGGVMSAGAAARLPVHTLLSGPAGGVAAAVHVGRIAGYRNLITYDMGGTSTDVCLIKDLTPTMSAERKIAGYPNKTLQVDINTIGAGGGSLAWVDVGDALRVGPQSAAASPGPACYGKGGAAATVTDANLVLGRLSARVPLGGEIPLRADLAREALGQVARRFPGLDEVRAADGIVKIAVTKMTGAIKEISIARGYDPRDFVLLAYGGAGPLHATLIAAELGMGTVLIPPAPGNVSAFGMLVSDIRRDAVRTRIMATRGTTLEAVAAVFGEMEAEGEKGMLAEGVARDRVRYQRTLGMRYVGQSFELAVPWRAGFRAMEDIEEAFHRLHQERYSHSTRKATEIVNFRLSTFGSVPKPEIAARQPSGGSPADALVEQRPVYFDGAFVETGIYQRHRLPVGFAFEGPAILEEMGATTVVTPGYDARVDPYGNIVLARR